MIMLVLGAHAYSQDDNLTSDTSNRRVQHGPNAKEQLSLTDTERLHHLENKAGSC